MRLFYNFTGVKLNAINSEFSAKKDGLFVDWLSVWQVHPAHAPLNSGCVTTFDGGGAAVFERHRSARISGSHSTSCLVKSDGSCVVLSGNFGRLNRADNLFNFDPLATLERANIAAEFAGLPVFQLGYGRNVDTAFQDRRASIGDTFGQFAENRSRSEFIHLSRVDLTKNYCCGSLTSARAVIRSISGKSISRVKKGVGGDSSVWWSNTRYMLKVYIKALEMEAHGVNSGRVYEYARDNGIIRLELELKRRELHTLGWSDFNDFLTGWEMGNVHKLFADYEKILTCNSVENESEFIDSLPMRLRPAAAIFMSGKDVRDYMSRASFFRYRKALLDYGIDISDELPSRIQVSVQKISIEPLIAPEWYWRAA